MESMGVKSLVHMRVCHLNHCFSAYRDSGGIGGLTKTQNGSQKGTPNGTQKGPQGLKIPKVSFFEISTSLEPAPQ